VDLLIHINRYLTLKKILKSISILSITQIKCLARSFYTLRNRIIGTLLVTFAGSRNFSISYLDNV
jgi:hypothetical protein